MSYEKISDDRDVQVFKMLSDMKRREMEREHKLKMHEMMLNMIMKAPLTQHYYSS